MKKFSLLFLIITFCCTSNAQTDATGSAPNSIFKLYEKHTYTNNDNILLPFRILYPENYDKKKKYPLVLFLHGAGERGDDNESQLTHGAQLFLQEENRKNYPAIVVFPQCPKESFWSSVIADRNKTPVQFAFDYSRPSNVPLVSSFELVKQLMNEESIDPTRIYVVGLSMGGMGTFEMVYQYPNLFAAAMPICGGGDVSKYDSRILKTSFWIFHGTKDPVVDVKTSREMVDRLKKLKAEVKYTEYPEALHNSWDNAFVEPEFLKWMFGNVRR